MFAYTCVFLCVTVKLKWHWPVTFASLGLTLTPTLPHSVVMLSRSGWFHLFSWLRRVLSCHPPLSLSLFRPKSWSIFVPCLPSPPVSFCFARFSNQASAYHQAYLHFHHQSVALVFCFRFNFLLLRLVARHMFARIFLFLSHVQKKDALFFILSSTSSVVFFYLWYLKCEKTWFTLVLSPLSNVSRMSAFFRSYLCSAHSHE